VQRISQADAFAELVRRAAEGNQTCLQGLREVLDKNPSIWQHAGDVAALAERVWIDQIAGGNSLVEESIRRRAQALKASLGGSNPTALETMVIDFVGVTWLAAHHGELAAAQTGGSVQQVASRLRRAESGQRRFLNSVKTLALVRALAPRTLPPRPGEGGRDGPPALRDATPAGGGQGTRSMEDPDDATDGPQDAARASARPAARRPASQRS
jgi:hypothetical protein